MNKLFRWLLILAGVVVVLVAGLSVAVLVLVDPNDYRDEIAAAVEEQTGRQLRIDGDLSLDVFPCCGVALGPLELGNPAGWEQQEFAAVERASVDVQVLPLLLSQELKVGKIKLDGLDLRLVRRRDGSVNWELESSADADDSKDETEQSGGASLAVAGIAMANSRIVYVDEVAGDAITLADIALDAGSISNGAAFPLSATLTATGLVPDAELRLELDAEAVLDTEALIASLTDLALTVQANGAGVPGGAAELAVEIAAVTGLGAERVEVRELAVDGTAAGAAFQLSGAGTLDGETPQFAGQLIVPKLAPRDVLAALGEAEPQTADPQALQAFDLRGNWTLQGDVASLEDVVAKLDDSNLTGSLKAASLDRERYEFALQLDEIDADRYLAPNSEVDAGEGESSVDRDERLDLPVETLRELNLRGTLDIGRLKFADLRLTDASIVVRAADGLIVLNPLTADLYGGKYAGNVRINAQGKGKQAPPTDLRVDARDASLRLSVNEKLRGIQVGDLLKDTGNAAPLTGLVNVRVRGSAAGNSINGMLRRLRGDADFNLQQGTYQGTDVWHEIRTARARLKGESPPPAPAAPFTKIDDLAGSFDFAGGTLRSRDFIAGIPFLQLRGSGAVDLLTSRLDYKLQAKVYETPVFDDGESLDNLTGLTLPLTISGGLDAPRVGVDLSSLAKEVGKQKVRDKLLEKLGLDEDTAEAPADASNTTEAAEGAPSSDTEEQDLQDEAKERVKDKLRDFLGG